MLKGKKVAIFDMDGTLIDSVGVWNDIDKKLIARLGAEQSGDEDVQFFRDALLRENRSKQNPYLEYCRYLGQKYGCALTAEEIQRLRYDIATEQLENAVDYKPDAERLIQKLKALGLTLAIATTTKRDNMKVYLTRNQNIIRKAPLDEYFSLILTKEDANELKPSPEIYHRVIRELGVTPEDCLVFEDSLVGVEAACAAGIDVAVMYDKYSDRERDEINLKASYSFDSFAELIDAIDKELCTA